MGGSVKDVDTKARIVTGFFSSTGTLDTDNDIFEETAFSKTIAEWGPGGKNRIWHLYQHDEWMPVNKPSILKETPLGVYFETKLLNTDVGNMLLALYEAGAMNEHSVAIEVVKATEQKGTGARLIKEVKMYEGSSVLWGANERTPTLGLKTDQIAHRATIIEKLLKNGNFEKDEVFELLQRALNRLQKALQPEPMPPLEPQNKAKERRQIYSVKLKLS